MPKNISRQTAVLAAVAIVTVTAICGGLIATNDSFSAGFQSGVDIGFRLLIPMAIGACLALKSQPNRTPSDDA